MDAPRQRIHLVGVGGSGMSGIAELLVRQGHTVSGTDLDQTPITERLATLGVRISYAHRAEHVDEAEVVVYSSAIDQTNPELVEARRRSLRIVPRGEMLAALTAGHVSIAVSGAHGKTTTTSMIAYVLEQAGLDPTAVIGARLSAFGSSARAGSGKYMVVEADESDRSFLKLSPFIAVITNIDREHLENYGDFDDLCGAFRAFATNGPGDGVVVACLDDANVRAIVEGLERRVVGYGLDSRDVAVAGSDVRLEGPGGRCTVQVRRDPSGRVEQAELSLNIPGRHNLQNALAAVAVGVEAAVPLDRIVSALATFRGADRRFDRRGEVGRVLVVDDYGHHPTEIAAVLSAARHVSSGRVLVAFQPHRYTRTRDLMKEFGPALAGADEIWLADIYSAGEAAIPAVTIDRLAEEVRRVVSVPVHIVRDLHDIPGAIAGRARPGDVIMTIGAGSIGRIADQVVDELRRLSAAPGG